MTGGYERHGLVLDEAGDRWVCRLRKGHDGPCPLHRLHNHMTRDIKPPGECHACDEYHRKVSEDPGFLALIPPICDKCGRKVIKAKRTMLSPWYWKHIGGTGWRSHPHRARVDGSCKA